jgi:hypothetical protein
MRIISAFPQKRTFADTITMSALCQLEKNGIAAKFASVVPTATLARLRLNLDFAALGR